MGEFTILFTPATFYVQKTSEFNTGNSVVYCYEIFADEGESLDIALTAGLNKTIEQDGVTTVFSDGNFTFSNSMKICFTMSNSATFGTFNEVTFTVDRPTAGVAEYAQFTDTIINYND
tara:strand:- start:4901 stop:5254 length:354 start_codon:yes stop_codon:yes gene_type:complete